MRKLANNHLILSLKIWKDITINNEFFQPPPTDFSWITPDLFKVIKDRNVFKFPVDYGRIMIELLRKFKDINIFKLHL